MSRDEKEIWESSFSEQVARQAYNTAPVEAVIRNVSYYLRSRFPDGDFSKLHFLEMGCGAGPNLVWLAEKGIRVSGVDISPTALGLAKGNLESRGHAEKVGSLLEASVADVPFPDASFNGIVEACVFQHLDKDDRKRAFGEVARLLKPGGLFVGYMLGADHTVFQARRNEQTPDDAGTVSLHDGKSKIYLTNIGLAHFFTAEEIRDLFSGFTIVDPCRTDYDLPREEAARRGYDQYHQSMWTVYAVK